MNIGKALYQDELRPQLVVTFIYIVIILDCARDKNTEEGREERRKEKGRIENSCHPIHQYKVGHRGYPKQFLTQKLGNKDPMLFCLALWLIYYILSLFFIQSIMK